MKAPEALDRMLAGEPVEAPESVRELAELAALLQGALQEGPTPAAAGRVREAAMQAFAAARTMPTSPPVAPIRAGGGRRVAARLALVAALVLGLPTAAWATSDSALPGEILYPLKRGLEETRLILAGDAADEAAVLLGMAEERLGEAILGRGLGRDDVVDQALVGYDDAMLRFQARIVEAQGEGLAVQPLLEEAAQLADVHDELFEVPADPVPALPEISIDPTEPSVQGKGGKAKGHGGGKGEGKGGPGKGGKGGNGKGNGNGRGQSGGGSGSSQGSNAGGGGNSGGGSADAGGNTGGGGNAGGDGGKHDDPPPPAPEDEDDDEHDEGSEGLGLGHEKAKGKGHTKDKGEGHDHD